MRFELGLFDLEGAKTSKYASIGKDVVGQESHQNTSLQASREAMVLLKNSDVLPTKKGQKVAVIGQAADSLESMLGNYNGQICPDKSYNCFPSIFSEVSRINGDATALVASTDVTNATAAAKAADFLVLVIDNYKDGGGEGSDRYTIGLEDSQKSMVDAVLQLKKPTVLVILSGGLISIDDLTDTAPAIIQAFMPGVHGGRAIAETIFGDNNPGGKMPVTMYHSSYINEVDFFNMSMVNGLGRSYKYYKGTPLYPFGFGLSYTTFSLAPALHQSSITLPSTGSITLKVTLTNTGKVPGDEVVFAYMTNETQVRLDTPMPIKSLLTFQRSHLNAGESTTVDLELQAKRFALVNSKGVKTVVPGSYTLQVDRGHGTPLKFVVEITGEPVTLFSLKPWWNEEAAEPVEETTIVI